MSIPIVKKYKILNFLFGKKCNSQINDFFCDILKNLNFKMNFNNILILVDSRFRVLNCIYLYEFFKNKNIKFTIIVDDYFTYGISINRKKKYSDIKKLFYSRQIGRFLILYKIKRNINTYLLKKKNIDNWY